jgi:quercetin dioxygenase-like cupin family protein
MLMRGNLDRPIDDEPFPGVQRTSFSSPRSTVTQYRFAPHSEFPRHVHDQEQITIVQEGQVEFSVGGSVHQLTEGDWVVVEPRIEHGLTAGLRGARVLAIVSPARVLADEFDVVAGSEPGLEAGS